MIRLLSSIVAGAAYLLTIALLVVVVGSWGLERVHAWNRHHTSVPGLNPDLLRAVHPGLSRQDIVDLLEETYFGDGQFVYEPYLERKERPRKGRFISVSPEGFRETGRLNLTLADNSVARICLFGGSAVFGYGVDDKNTIAGYLQRLLDRQRPNEHWAVFNFGSATYFLQQEGVQFYRLTEQGVRCKVVIFLDGSAEADNDQPVGSQQIARLFQTSNYDHWQHAIDLLKSMTLSRDILSRVIPAIPVPVRSPGQIVRIYEQARTMIRGTNEIHGAKLLFILAPAPGYRNRWFNNPYKVSDCADGSRCAAPLIATMDALVASAARDPESHDLTGLFADWTTTPVLDAAHYTPRASDVVSQALYSLIFP